MRTPAFCMAKVGLKPFPWQAHEINERFFLQRGKLIRWPFKYPQRQPALCPALFAARTRRSVELYLRFSENAGPRSGPQFGIVPKCAEPYRCLGRHGAWDLAGDSGRLALTRKVAKFCHDSPQKTFHSQGNSSLDESETVERIAFTNSFGRFQ